MMRDSFYLASLIGEHTKKSMLQVIEHDGDNFSALVRASGLNPAKDFRFANLECVSFDNSDLRGFDFTGASLIGATGDNVLWDDTTILTNAEIGHSIFDKTPPLVFDHALPDAFLRQHWTDIIIWIDRLRSTPDNYLEDARKLLFVFLKSDDPFVRRTAMNVLAKYVSPEAIIGIIDKAVFKNEEKDLVSAAFKLLGSLYEKRPSAVVKIALAQLGGRWAAESAVFLSRILKPEKGLRHLVELIARHESQVVRRRFIASLAEREGAAVMFVVRDPFTGDVFDYGTRIKMETLDSITRAVVRKRQSVLDDLKRGETRQTRDGFTSELALLDAYSGRTKDAIKAQIVRKIEAFNKYGLKYRLPISVASRSEVPFPLRVRRFRLP